MTIAVRKNKGGDKLRLKTWLITYGSCYAVFLGSTALWLKWATSDVPQDFWPVFTVEAVAGIGVAWLLGLAFWKILWMVNPGAFHYHRAQRELYAKMRGRRRESGQDLRLDPAGDSCHASFSATAHV
jgi:hypothetical protein